MYHDDVCDSDQENHDEVLDTVFQKLGNERRYAAGLPCWHNLDKSQDKNSAIKHDTTDQSGVKNIGVRNGIQAGSNTIERRYFSNSE